ncbi:MAG: sensor histidine kinase [Saprospiraceae bacterium]|nr:sensor histidine kinase [Saprospiraceae bacterium]
MKSARTLLLHILVCSIYCVGFSQTPTDSLKTKLETALSDQERLEILDELSEYYRKRYDPATIPFSKQTIVLAKELKDWETYLNRANLLADFYTFDANYPDSARMLIDEALFKAEEVSPKNEAKLYLTLTDVYDRKGELDSAWSASEKALDIYKNLNDSTIRRFAWSYNVQGKLLRKKGEISTAQEAFNNSIRLYEYQEDSLGMLSPIQGLTILFAQAQIYDEAKKYRSQVVFKARELGRVNYVITENYNAAMDERKQGNQELERSYLLKMLKEAEKKEEETDKNFYNFVGWSAISSAYGRANIKDSLNYYYSKAKELQPNYANDPYASHFYNNASAYKYLLDRNFDRALDYAAQYEAVAQKSDKENMIYVNELYSNIYKAKGDYGKSLQYFKKYSSSRDSLFNVSKVNTLSYYQTEFETAKKEKQIAIQEASIQELNTKNRLNRRLYLSLVGLVAISGIAALLWKSQQASKKNAAIQQQFAQKLILSQESERKRISKELHDSVGQSLVLIKNKVHLSGTSDTEELVSNTIQEVRSISRGLHPQALDKLGLTAAIEKLVDDADNSTDIFFSREIDAIDGYLSKAEEINVYRIVQESISNLIKHSGAPSALIKTVDRTSDIEVMIKDNGAGFDLTEKSDLLNSLGMKTLKERAEMLKAKFSLDSTKGEGTTVLLQVPK